MLKAVTEVDRLHGILTKDYATSTIATDITVWWSSDSSNSSEQARAWDSYTTGQVVQIGPLAADHMSIVSNETFVRDVACHLSCLLPESQPLLEELPR